MRARRAGAQRATTRRAPRVPARPTGTMRSRSPLPTTRRRPRGCVVRRELETAHLAGAQAAAVQQLQHRAIAQAAHVVVPAAVQQQRAICLGHGIGQAATATRPHEHERGIVRALAAAHEIAEQRASRREVPRDGGRREPACRRAAPASGAAFRCSQVSGTIPCCARKPQSSSRSPRSARTVCGESPCAMRAASRRSTAGALGMCVSSLMQGEAFGYHASAPLNTSGRLCPG